MYKEGKKISEIASTRNLTITTIEGHLAHFIESGELDIATLVTPAKQLHVRDIISKTGTVPLQKIKEQLPDISYGELKWVIASEKYLARKNQMAIGQNHPVI